MSLLRFALRPVLRALRRLGGRRVPQPAGPSGRRAILFHIDGVGRATLDAAMRSGHFPFLRRALEKGTHRVATLRAGAPASTAAFQVGLLHGRTEDVPGYVWYDKRLGRRLKMDAPDDVALVERREGAEREGLLIGGTSYAALFMGDAAVATMNLRLTKHHTLNLASLKWPRPLAFAVHAILAAAVWPRLLFAIPRDLFEGIRWSLRVGTTAWEWRLFYMRTLSDTMRQVTTWSTVADMTVGIPIVYACTADYDEIAHRRGPRASVAMRHLRAADKAAEVIFTAAEELPEMRYDVYALSDHGQVDAIPFESVAGVELTTFLREATGSSPDPSSPSKAPSGVEIVEAGDIAHLYFTGSPEPMLLEEIERRHPAILAALQTSDAVPFLVARSATGPVVMAGRRYYHLGDESTRAALEALPAFRGPERDLYIGYVERLVGMGSAGDLVLYGNRGADEPAIAFSWEFGSHGGIGAGEVDAFVIHPANAGFDFGAVTLPEELYAWFTRYRRSEHTEEAPLYHGSGSLEASP